MRRETTLSYILLISLAFGCSRPESSESTADALSAAHQLVMQSIEKHGGLENWNNLKSIAFTKTTILFDSSGSEESRVTQRNHFILQPELEGWIKWQDKGDSIMIIYKNGEAVHYINDQPDSSASESAKNTVMAALYVLFQPFKLIDEGVQLEYIGEGMLDSVMTAQVRPVYEGAAEGDDQWTFYINTSSNETIANLVNHKGRRSLIKNLSFDTTSALRLHHHRKSYFVDSLLKINYLRAEYYYTEYKMEY